MTDGAFDIALARRDDRVDGRAIPRARFAAMADASVQPVPWVCRSSMRGAAILVVRPVGRAATSMLSGPSEVAAFHQYDARTEREDPAAGLAHVVERA